MRTAIAVRINPTLCLIHVSTSSKESTMTDETRRENLYASASSKRAKSVSRSSTLAIRKKGMLHALAASSSSLESPTAMTFSAACPQLHQTKQRTW